MSIRTLMILVSLLAFQLHASAQVITDAGGRFETLLGLRVGQRAVAFDVAGQGEGCTRKDHFHVERFGDDPVRLILIRDGNFPGDCRHDRIFRQGNTFTYRELGLQLGDRIEIVNPVEINDIPRAPKE